MIANGMTGKIHLYAQSPVVLGRKLALNLNVERRRQKNNIMVNVTMFSQEKSHVRHMPIARVRSLLLLFDILICKPIIKLAFPL